MEAIAKGGHTPHAHPPPPPTPAINTGQINDNERMGALKTLTTEQIQAGYVTPSRLRGVIVAYSGLRYAGTPYLLVYTPTGITYWVERGNAPPEYFKMMNTISFTPTPELTKLKKFPEIFVSGEDPMEFNHPNALPAFIPGKIHSVDGKSKVGKIMMVVDEFHQWHGMQDKLTRAFYYDQLTQDSVTPMVGDDILFATQTQSFGRQATSRWPLICAIADNEELRVRTFTMATTPSFYSMLQLDYEFNFEIGGTIELSNIPCFLAQHETRIPNIDKTQEGANILGEMLAFAENHYTKELHKLSDAERKVSTHPVVVGERTFRMARTQEAHRLKILINPLLFKHIDTSTWIMLVERYCTRHDGSLVDSIHILTIMDDRSNSENWTKVNPILPLMQTPLSHLSSITFIPEEVQLGRWAPYEWIDRRSDCRYMVSTMDFMTMEARDNLWPEMITLAESNGGEVGDGTETEMEAYFDDSTALLASTPHRFRRDRGLLSRWRANGTIKGAAPRRQGGAEFVCMVLKHRSGKGRDETASGLREPIQVGGMDMRHFMCMAADTFFNAHVTSAYSPVIILANNTDHNVIYEALGAHTAMQPIGKGQREIRIHNAWLTKVEIRMRLAQVNADCVASGQPRPFLALHHGYGEKPTWLVARRALQPHPASHTPRKAEGNRSGFIYLSGLEADHDMDVITRTLHSLTILPTHQPKWVEVEGYHRDLIEVHVEDREVYAGIHFKAETGITICTVIPNTDASISQDGFNVFAPLLHEQQAQVQHPQSNYHTSDKQKQMLLAIREANRKRMDSSPAKGKGGWGRGRGRGRGKGGASPPSPAPATPANSDGDASAHEDNWYDSPPKKKTANSKRILKRVATPAPATENKYDALYNEEEDVNGENVDGGEDEDMEEGGEANEDRSDDDMEEEGDEADEGGEGGEEDEWMDHNDENSGKEETNRTGKEVGGMKDGEEAYAGNKDGGEEQKGKEREEKQPPQDRSKAKGKKEKKERKQKNTQEKENTTSGRREKGRARKAIKSVITSSDESANTTADEELSQAENTPTNSDGEEVIEIVDIASTAPSPQTLAQNKQRESRQEKRATNEGEAQKGKATQHTSPTAAKDTGISKRAQARRNKKAKKGLGPTAGQPSVAVMFRTAHTEINNTLATPTPKGGASPHNATTPRDRSLSPSQRERERSRSRSSQDSASSHHSTGRPQNKGGRQQ